MKLSYSYLPEQFADFESYVDELREWVKSGEFTLGPYVDRFEKTFAKFVGVKHCIAVNNGTDALILCLKSLGVGPGDEVITVANTFYATVGAIVAVGARPVFVDCDKRYSIDVKQIEKKITAKTKVILPVHWAGMPPRMDEIMKIAAKHKLKVVEDACPAVGASIDGKQAGSFGHINAFSMHPLKPLNVWGDGGMVVTNDDKMNEWLRTYRNHGMVDRDHIVMWGINARLQPIQAIVGNRVLSTIHELIKLRVRNAQYLDQHLAPLKGHVEVCERLPGYGEAYQLYLARFKHRDELLGFLQKNEIEARVHYPLPLHLQKPGLELGYKVGDFPEAESQAKEIITLPAHQHISLEQLDFMTDKIFEFYKVQRKKK